MAITLRPRWNAPLARPAEGSRAVGELPPLGFGPERATRLKVRSLNPARHRRVCRHRARAALASHKYCRLAQQKLLNDQAVAIMDDVFERRAADKSAKVAARRAAIKPVS